MSLGALIDDELARFVRGPVASFLATADALGTPDAARVYGVVAIGGDRLRVLISSDAETALRNAVPGASMAVLVTDITNYRSVQWKGSIVEANVPQTPGDLALIDEYLQRFAAASPLVGIPSDVCWRMFPLATVAVVVQAEEMFDQTPGPAAGRRVEASR
ncbi:MAG: hypothetical protein JWM12_2121 [Ilumatobacteraceae bacterium]|nr:hypothetical protein [Ilumatobacteraceae bacterium]